MKIFLASGRLLIIAYPAPLALLLALFSAHSTIIEVLNYSHQPTPGSTSLNTISSGLSISAPIANLAIALAPTASPFRISI